MPLHIITRVSSVGNVNTRLPVAVKPTSMHVLVCTYEGLIYGRPLYYSCIVQYDDDTHTYGAYYVVPVSLVSSEVAHCTFLTHILRGGARLEHHAWNDVTATRTQRTRLARRDNQRFDGCVPALLYPYTYHGAPLICCEWRNRVNGHTTSIP